MNKNILKNFKSKSKLTEEDALRLGKEVSKKLSNKLRNRANNN